LEKLINIFDNEIKNIQAKLNTIAKSIPGDKS